MNKETVVRWMVDLGEGQTAAWIERATYDWFGGSLLEQAGLEEKDVLQFAEIVAGVNSAKVVWCTELCRDAWASDFREDVLDYKAQAGCSLLEAVNVVGRAQPGATERCLECGRFLQGLGVEYRYLIGYTRSEPLEGLTAYFGGGAHCWSGPCGPYQVIEVPAESAEWQALRLQSGCRGGARIYDHPAPALLEALALAREYQRSR